MNSGKTAQGQEKPPRFPIGGSRDKVYSFLRIHGFIMSDWSDKHWHRADGINLRVYGTGSMAIITAKDGHVIADAPLDKAVLNLT